VRNVNFFTPHGLIRTALAKCPLWAAAGLLLSGCTNAYYRRSADKEVYGIVQKVEAQIFGHTNAFTINTPYSSRKPKDIPASELIDDRLLTNARMLTVEGALDLAVTNSRSYQAAKETLYLTTLTLTGERYAFSPQFFATSTGQGERNASGESLANVNSQVGVNQLLASGGSLGLKLVNDVLRYYTGDPRQSIISALSVNVTQPLLRGFGRNNPAVEVLTQGERNVVYAVRNYEFFQDQFAMEVVNDYFDLLALKDVIRNRYKDYQSWVQSTQRLAARANDREKLVDVDQARQQELAAKNSYINALASYRNALDQFKIRLGLPVGEAVHLDDDALTELEQKGLVPATLNSDAAYRLAVANQPLVLNAIDQFEDSKRKVRVTANQLRPELNFIGNASLNSEPPTDYTRFDPDKLRGGVGLELDLPINPVPRRNAYRAILVSFEAELRSLTLTLDNLKESIDRAQRTLLQKQQNYLIQNNALELAKRRVTSITMLLQAGRAEVRDLVDAQNAQLLSENAVTASLVEYQVARLQLLLDLGVLDTAAPRFWLKDHLPDRVLGAPRQSGPAETASQPLVPPDQFFKN
jgi:outer membrane protein TolC